MKRFKDLTELEIKDLEYDDLQKYILIECAENGIKIVDCPEIPAYEPELEKDDICYNVGGFPSLYLQFSDVEEVQAVVQLLNSFTSIKNKDKDRFYSIEKRLCYSDKTEKENKKVEERNTLLKAHYQTLRNEYEIYLENKKEYADAIYEKFNSVCEKYARLDMIKRKYSETYLPLADNDETIAKRFLKNAFIVPEDDEQYIFS